MQVTLQGNPLTLVGNTVSVGDEIPDVTLVNGELQDVSLSEVVDGKVAVIAAVPSLDTPVCDAETRRFNEAAAGLGPDVAVVTVSVDLPFAQARWCGAAGIDRVTLLSDYRDRAFGHGFGVLLEGISLLARAVFVADRNGKIQYVQIVPEIAQEPDYEAVLAAVRELV
jgi:thiol peroxidase